MFGNIAPAKTFTIGKVISGLSKTLNVANQIIPLYQQAKPAIANAKTLFQAMKEIQSSDKKQNAKTKLNQNLQTNKKAEITNCSASPRIAISNSPTFFL